MSALIVLPGYGDSGATHWQSRWQANDASITRLQPGSWDQPERSDWIEALTIAVEQADTPPILIAHSLGCLLVAAWQQVSDLPVAGAFLVAVPDPELPGFEHIAPSFRGIPNARLRFPSLVVASTNDPYDPHGYGREKAREWGSTFHDVGERGHINGDSGLGDWAAGQQMLRAFRDTLGA